MAIFRKDAGKKTIGGFLLQCFAFLCFLTSFCVNEWYFVKIPYGHAGNEKTLHLGLWQSCLTDYPSQSKCTDTTSTEFRCPGWFTAVQVMMCLAFVFYFVSVFTLMGKMFIDNVAAFSYTSHIILVGIFVGTVLTIISCVVFGSNANDLETRIFEQKSPEKHPGPVEKVSYGYAVVVISAVLHIISGIFRFFSEYKNSTVH